MTVATATTRKTVGTIRQRGRPLAQKMMCVAAAAALSTSTHAWTGNGRLPYHRVMVARGSRAPGSALPPRVFAATAPPRTTLDQTRLYSSSNMQPRFNRNGNDDDNDDDSLLGAAKKAAKSVLPTKWFGTKEEKEALRRKKEAKNRVQGELDQMLKGAPLPIKMFGKMVAGPLMGKFASMVEEAGQQQKEMMETTLDEAREYLLNDPNLVDLLGVPVQIGQPFQQASSTVQLNGRYQVRMEFASEVSGPKSTGVSRIVATDDGIAQLLVEVNGKVFDVDLSSRGRRASFSSSPLGGASSSSGGPSGGSFDDTIIEAEIIDKETK